MASKVTRTQVEESPSTLIGLCTLVRKLGYEDEMHRLQLSRDACIGDLIDFLEDNPGVFEPIYEWISENHAGEDGPELDFDDAIKSLQTWAYGDSHVELANDELCAALETDMTSNGGRRLTEAECEEMITGGDEGEVSDELKKAFPAVFALVASKFE